MATLSSSSTSTQDPTPPGSWPPPTQEDGSDLPSHSLSTHPQATDSLLPSPSTSKDESPVLRTASRGLNMEFRKARPHRGRYEPSHPNYRLTREQLREIAGITLNKLDSGFYVPPPFKSRAQAEEEAKMKAAEEAEAEAREREKEMEKEKGQAESQSASESESISDVEPSLEGQDQDGKQGQAQETEGSDERKEEEEEKGKNESDYSYAYDLVSKMEYTNMQTEFYASDDPFISNWSLIASGSAESNGGASEAVTGDADPSPLPRSRSRAKTRILIREYSTLVGARRLHALNRRKREKDAGRDDSGDDNDKIGVLNFASAKKPGGGFLFGAQAQEESLARSSTLFPSLITLTASPFYEHYRENQKSPTIAYYTHAMVYSPSVVLFRNDKGLWMSPVEVDILTSAAVNAGEVRERVRYEEELREVRERWEKMEAERKRVEEEERRKEQEEWEAVLKDNEEMKRRYGDGELGQTGVDGGSTIGNPPADKPVEEVTEDPTGIPSGSSDTLLTPSITTVSSTQVDDHSHKETPPSPAQDKDKGLQESTAPVASDSTSAPEPVDTPSEPKPDPMALAELEIEAQMQERIARILALFASPRRPSDTESPATNNNQPRTPHLILGSFGTGVFQNHVPLVARIFYDLIARRGAPFAGVFDTVVFAILGTGTVNVFREVFAGRSGVPQDGVLGVEELLEMDGWVEVVLEGEDEDEIALEMEEEVGCEEEGLLRVVEDATEDQELVSNVEDGSGGEDKGQERSDVPINIDVDEVEAEATEIEMRDGTHDSDESTERGYNRNGSHGNDGSDGEDVDVEMLDTADDVHVHPPELVDVEPTAIPTSA